MTFYNIVFGILFVSSCRQVLLLSGTGAGWTAATIAFVVFNDAVNSSHLLEGADAREYSFRMKIFDLVAFVLLSLALIALSPRDNPFGVAPSQWLEDLLSSTWMIWVLLSGYWILAWLWNSAAGLTSPHAFRNGAHSGPITFAAIFALLALLAALFWPNRGLPTLLRILACICTGLYLWVIKSLLRLTGPRREGHGPHTRAATRG